MSSEDAYIGEQIGNYHVVDRLAVGGFGIVCLGQHVLFPNRIVAIKLLQTRFLHLQEEHNRFLLEAHFLEKLKHPYILPLIDAGIDEGLPYLVTEYMPNGSLQERLEQQFPHPLSMEEALTILSRVGEALQYVHQKKVIHCDIKPANILFNARGEAFLGDFGIATALTTASTIYSTKTIIGSFAYMAPERFQGVRSKKSDQYALGCIAYRLLTGYPPFRGSDPAVLMYRHLHEKPIALRLLNPVVPVYVEQAVLKAMAKQRVQRYSDIPAFLRALHL